MIKFSSISEICRKIFFCRFYTLQPVFPIGVKHEHNYVFVMFIFAMKKKQKDSKIFYQFWKISTKITCRASALWCVLSLFGPIVSFTCTLNLWYNIGMARGIPRPSILEVPDLFSLLDSPRNRFNHSSTPRVLAKIHRGPRKYWISFFSA